jgi:catechol 2,3-dioxygenase-like lactoylglutathione lyase family enzyme/broad-specificity NMP kinase
VRVVILCGLPGVGKLSVANELARTGGYRVFHNHLVFDAVEALFPFGSAAFVELRERLWVELLGRAVRERVGSVVFTIARDRSVAATFVRELVRTLSGLGAEVHCIELTCSDAELEQRVASAGRAAYGKVHTAARLRELRAAGAFPSFALPTGSVAIDTSGLSVQQSAERIRTSLSGDLKCDVGHQTVSTEEGDRTALLESASPVLASLDIERTVAFYRDRLGFSKVRAEPGVWGIVARDSVQLHFWACAERHIAENTSCRIHVRGIDPLFAACDREGIVHPNARLEAKPWGSREFGVLDPDGNLVTFAERAARS